MINEVEWVCPECRYTPAVFLRNRGGILYDDRDVVRHCPHMQEQLAQGKRQFHCPHHSSIRHLIVQRG